MPDDFLLETAPAAVQQLRRELDALKAGDGGAGLADVERRLGVLETGLAAKANQADLTSGLATKANTSALTSGLAAKADTAALTSVLAGKANQGDLTALAARVAALEAA